MPETVSATTSAIHSSTDSLDQGPVNPAAPSPDNASSSNTPAADERTPHTSSPAADSLTESMSHLAVDPSTESKPNVESTSDSNEAEAIKEPEEELSPEEAKLRAKGLKSTHRPGFYIHINSPRKLRIQTKSKTFDLDRYCPHANADMLKWGVLRADMTLRCGVHYWGFDLVKNGQCIAHPDETLNACPVADSEMEW